MGFPPKHSIYNIYSYHVYIFIYIFTFLVSNSLSLAPHSLFLDSKHQSLQSTGRGLASLDPPHLSYHVYKYLSLFTLLAFKLSPCRHLHSQRKSLSSRVALLAGQGSCFARPATFLLPCISRARYATTLFLCSPLRARYATTLFLCSPLRACYATTLCLCSPLLARYAITFFSSLKSPQHILNKSHAAQSAPSRKRE